MESSVPFTWNHVVFQLLWTICWKAAYIFGYKWNKHTAHWSFQMLLHITVTRGFPIPIPAPQTVYTCLQHTESSESTDGRDITWGVNLAGFFINLGDAASYKFSPELLLSYRTEGYREFCIRWYERKTNYLWPTKIPEGCFLKALTCQDWSRAMLPDNSWVLSSVHRAFVGDVSLSQEFIRWKLD